VWKIPLFDSAFTEEEIKAAQRIIASGWLTMGEATRKFEALFAEFLGVKHAFAVSNGTAALYLSNMALDIGKGDEVICSSLNFVAGANVIVLSGAKVVFADIIGQHDLNISPEAIEPLITSRTKAIQVMHYGGYPCDMDKIREIAVKHDLFLIEDCAHSPGAEYKGKKCGTISDIGCFSFFSNKNMTTGEGGMIVTNNDQLAERIALMRSHGMTSLTLDRYKGYSFSYDVVELGFNFRIDEIRSSIGVVQLEKLYENNIKRGEIDSIYRKELSSLEQISTPFNSINGQPSYHIFPIILNRGINRKSFMEYLKSYGIQTSIHYPAIHSFTFYKQNNDLFNNNLPITEDIAQREVTLPLYPAMNDADVLYITDKVKKYFKGEPN